MFGSSPNDALRATAESPPSRPLDSETISTEPDVGADTYPGLRRVLFRRECETVTLCGRVPTYYLKQLAIEKAKKIAGVTKVIDRLDVCE